MARLILAVVVAFVAVGVEWEPCCPVGWGRHELAGVGDGEAGVGWFVNNDFVVDVHDDPVPSLSDESYAVDEQVTSDRLDDVLDQLSAVGFQPPPLASGRDTAVGDGGAAPSVLTKLGLHVGQLSTGGQGDEQDAGLSGEAEVAQPNGPAGCDGVDRRLLDVSPELHDVGVGCPPGVDDGFEFVLGQPHP